MFLSPADFVSSKSTFSKDYFRNTISVPNSLGSDQARRFVGPGLDPLCLQMFSADDISMQGVTKYQNSSHLGMKFSSKLLKTNDIKMGKTIILTHVFSQFQTESLSWGNLKPTTRAAQY